MLIIYRCVQIEEIYNTYRGVLSLPLLTTLNGLAYCIEVLHNHKKGFSPFTLFSKIEAFIQQKVLLKGVQAGKRFLFYLLTCS